MAVENELKEGCYFRLLAIFIIPHLNTTSFEPVIPPFSICLLYMFIFVSPISMRTAPSTGGINASNKVYLALVTKLAASSGC